MVLNEYLRTYIERLKEGKEDSLIPLLPLFSINGEPMDLSYHYQLAPVFKLNSPKRMVLQIARQCGKTTAITAKGILLASLLPGFHILFVQPRCDQISRFNQTIVKPLLNNFLLKGYVTNSGCSQNTLIREFISGSNMYFEYAFLTVDRVRGIAANSCYLDEAQDLNYDFIDVITECASASKNYGFFTFTGTPKTTDGTLNSCWEDSSMSEWCIPCKRCNKLNISSFKQDLIKMLGKKGLSCSKCGKPIDTALGHYEHAFPDRRDTFVGYHISQPVHPLHCTIPAKWRELLYKMENLPKGRFMNEVLGEACDESVKLLGLTDLKQASNGGNCKLADSAARAKQYEATVIGVDWSGGGELSHSYTAIAVCGIKPGSDQIDCLYAERLPHGMRPEEEAKLVLQYMRIFQCAYVAHDFTGAGYLREVLLAQAGVPPGQIIPFSYVVQPSKDIIVYSPPSATGRYFYSIDKPRSLVVMCQMIKRCKVTLPEYDGAKEILSDLLALNEDPREITRGNIVYLIGKKPKTSDDFAHALNFACSAIWHSREAYPELADTERFRSNKDLMNLVDPAAVNWK